MSTRESRPTGAAPEIPAKASTDTITVPNQCCREAAAEVVREATAALVDIKAAAEHLASFTTMLDGCTYDDSDGETRDAMDEATMAALMLDSEVDTLLDRVRRIAWLHDLDHGDGR